MIVEISEEVVRGTAQICGEHSAAAKAIADAEKRRARGETVRFLKDDRGILFVHGVPANDTKEKG